MNYKLFSPVIYLIFVLFLISCNESIVDSSIDGNYKYTAYDSLGTVISRGWLKIIIKDSTNVSGSWEINKVGNPLNIGPQIGKGELEGSFNDSLLAIELNPDMVDNNVGLIGKYENNKYTGKWYWITLIGQTNWGRFEAVKE
jgi:hypothetical protein